MCFGRIEDVLMVLAIATVSVLTLGCGQPASETDDGSEATTNVTSDHDHGGYWCKEHGVPEAECSLCSAKAADAFRAKGDWCEEHNRAESQCFLCDSSRAEKFAKLYEAKFGHAPPKHEGEE